MARLDVNIITSLVGKGLEREAILLRELLQAHDVYCNFYHYTSFANSVFVRADVNISLEVMMPNTFGLAKENWFAPNCEWYGGQYDRFLPQMTKILCKTRDCERIWRIKLANDRPERVVYTGFECRDFYDPTIPREDKFLHFAGFSEFKNSEAVIEAWRMLMPQERNLWPIAPLPLTVVTSQPRFIEMCQDVPLLTCAGGRITDDEIKQLMNSHRFHIIPSMYEGFGHALHESIGCGGLVLTTNAPPMNEVNGIQRDWGVPVVRSEPRMLAQLNWTNGFQVAGACAKAIGGAVGNTVGCEQRSAAARAAFLSDREQFRTTILGLLGLNA